MNICEGCGKTFEKATLFGQDMKLPIPPRFCDDCAAQHLIATLFPEEPAPVPAEEQTPLHKIAVEVGTETMLNLKKRLSKDYKLSFRDAARIMRHIFDSGLKSLDIMEKLGETDEDN